MLADVYLIATGFPSFLAELVVFGIGKVEILQYYLMRAGPLTLDSERQSRNITILSHCRAFSRYESGNFFTTILKVKIYH